MKNKNTFKTLNIHEKTPKKFYEVLDEEFHFDMDPCPHNSLVNRLAISWGKRCYINPPYGKGIRDWLEKAIKEIKEGNTNTAVFLLPANTDVKWFHEIVLPNAREIRFIKGRLKFSEHNNTAPFASMIVIFDNASIK